MRTLLIFLVMLRVWAMAQAAGPHWQHFDEHTFTEAKKQKKLVLLHLRANWCHWCHVMEEKTYPDKDVMALLNQGFIACMEDHDARPDLTSRYNDYGWPATIIFDEDGNELLKQAGYIPTKEMVGLLKRLMANPKPLNTQDKPLVAEPSAKEMATSLAQLKENFFGTLDLKLGGNDFAQRWIDAEIFEYALNHRNNNPSLSKWLHLSVKNADHIYDHSWGGFYQYSANGDWLHPHYEKLLSVQARYIKLFCWYYTAYKNPIMLKQALGTAVYAERFLKSAKGGYFNAQDADLIKGEKATAYFKLGNKERLKKGIPAIDENVYTAENAQFAEALVYLSKASGQHIYMDRAKQTIDFLLSHRKNTNGSFMHGNNYAATTSLSDHIYLAKTLLLLFSVTQESNYLKEADFIITYIKEHFDSSHTYFYSYIGKSALAPTYSISEHIELARLLHSYSILTKDTWAKETAKHILAFLLAKEQVAKMITEPGILTANEEIRSTTAIPNHLHR